jgi:hypothetical protein
MPQVECEVKEVELTNERGYPTEGVRAECSACGHATECYGTSDRSRRRALVMLREECPESEKNFYVEAA